MTDKELHKLNRQKLLELLLAQSKDVSQQRSEIEELAGSLDEARTMIERLKDKLNSKDEQLEHLKGRLNDKDATINALKDRVESQNEVISNVQASAEASVQAAQLNVAARERSSSSVRNIGFSIESGSEKEKEGSVAPGTPKYSAPTASAAAALAAGYPNVIPFPSLRPNYAPEQENVDGTAAAQAAGGFSAEDIMALSRAILAQYMELKQGGLIPAEVPAKVTALDRIRAGAAARREKRQAKPKGPALRERFARFRADAADTGKVWGELCAESWDDFWTTLKSFRWRDTDLYAAMRRKAADFFDLKQ